MPKFSTLLVHNPFGKLLSNDDFSSACTKAGKNFLVNRLANWNGVIYQDFEGKLSPDGGNVFIGTIDAVDQLQEKPEASKKFQWFLGANDDVFDIDKIHHLDESFNNSRSSSIVTLRELRTAGISIFRNKGWTNVFIRPVSGWKPFESGVVSILVGLRLLEKLDLDESIPILVGQDFSKITNYEYRILVHNDGEALTPIIGGVYNYENDVIALPSAPKGAYEFVSKLSKPLEGQLKGLPALFYADVVEIYGHHSPHTLSTEIPKPVYKIMELSCIHTASPYAIPPKFIIEAIDAVMEGKKPRAWNS